MESTKLKNCFKLAFCVYVLFIGQPTLAMMCDQIFTQRESYKPKPLSRFRDKLPGIVSRTRPTYTNPSFDLRVISMASDKNSFSAKALREKTIQDVGSVQIAYKQMGFSFRSFLQVVVEAHPGAIGNVGKDENENFYWMDANYLGPWVGDFRELIGLPIKSGQRDIFIGETENRGFTETPRILVIPALSSSDHSLFNPFTVAHELGHETENQRSHTSLLWREARADILAHLATGETDIVYPEGLTVELVRPDGTFYKEKQTILRSMIKPSVPSVKDIMPHLSAFHYNSQIISSALFRIGEKLGKARLIEFIHWMDRIEGEKIIRHLEAIPELEETRRFPSKVEYVNEQNISEIREAISQNLHKVGELLRQWSFASGLEKSDIQFIEYVLTERGI